MGDGDSVSSNLILRGVEYSVSFTVQDEALDVEVEDINSGEEWRGTFSAQHLEDMTHKTGNFKKFDVFVDMFRTVLTEPIKSLSVDLMTFSDLQELRRQKKGYAGKSTRSKANETNRYLILVYTAPYDRIYYPLTLSYRGRADPAQLKATILELRAELNQSRGGREIRQLRQETRRLRADNDKLREEMAQLRAAHSDAVAAAAVSVGADQRSEVRALKAVVTGLEEDLAMERSRVQRAQQKFNRERATLRDELEEARAGERLLRVRVRTLVNELALYKRDRVRSGHSPASSVHSVPVVDRCPPRSPRYLNSHRPSSSEGRREARPRPGSAEGRRETRPLSGRPSSEGSMDRLRRARARSASPRFDPTAYVIEQRRRREDSLERHKREIRSRLSGSSAGSRSMSPAGSRAGSASSSIGRHSGSGKRSRRPGYRTYFSSEDEDGVESDSSASVMTGSYHGRQPSSINSIPKVPHDRSRARTRGAPVATSRPSRSSKVPPPSGDVSFGGTYELEEMRDIDERINRLNQFLTQVIHERA